MIQAPRQSAWAGSPPEDGISPWDVASALTMLAALLLVLTGFTDFGIGWDEPLHVENGERALRWYATFGTDGSVLQFQNLYLYGAAYDLLAALAVEASPLDVYHTRRLLGGLVGLAGAVAVWLAAREFRARSVQPFSGARAGFLALALLLLMPDWWGHSFINPKDIPFAVCAAWVLVFTLRLCRCLDRPRWGDLAGLAVAAGLAMGIRVAGLLLFAPLAVAAVVWAVQRLRTAGPDWRVAAFPILRTGLRLAVPPAVAWVLMVAAWPWAWADPLGRPVQALTAFARFDLDFAFTFAGVAMRSTDLPWWYVPVGFAVKLPEPALLGLALALGGGLVAVLRRCVRNDGIALAVAILLPPILVVVQGTTLYDGVRHLLFLLPPLAVAAALGLRRLLVPDPRWLRLLALPALGAWGVWQLTAMATLHPYQYIQHNTLVGGTAGAAGRFDLDYWGTAMTEAARLLTAEMIRREGVAVLSRPLRLRFCGPPQSATHDLPMAWRGVPRGQGDADLYIAFTRKRCAGEPQGPEIIRVERVGVTLAFVRAAARPDLESDESLSPR